MAVVAVKHKKKDLVHIVQSSFGAMLPPSLWLSEKSILNKDILGVDLNNYQFFKDKFFHLCLGSGTMPGSLNTALPWARNSRNITFEQEIRIYVL